MNYLNNIVKMEVPICNGTYSSECDVPVVGFLNDVKQLANNQRKFYRTFFIGLCYFCKIFMCPIQPLQRCGGCQLVAYCSRDCQKKDRLTHKYVCKEFPVVNGNNALHTTGPWKKHIDGLRQRAAQLPYSDIAAKPIFRNPWVCHTCREARPDRLMNCQCSCVTYCSIKCAKADKHHGYQCDILRGIVESYSSGCIKVLPSLRDRPVCEKFSPLSNFIDVLPTISSNYSLTLQIKDAIERLSYPMSLLYALQSLPKRLLGRGHRPLETLAILDVHVITSSPLFDSEPWEVFMHRLPKLNQLNVVFVMQGKELKPSFNLNWKLSLLRCKDCEAKKRIITYSIQQMQYHMFFSSSEYIEPSVVVVYGNRQEMSANEDGDVNSEISYRNMTHSRDTILVLMDETKELVKQGARAVNAAQPVDQLVSVRNNPLSAYNNVFEIEPAHDDDTSEKDYFTCLRRK